MSSLYFICLVCISSDASGALGKDIALSPCCIFRSVGQFPFCLFEDQDCTFGRPVVAEVVDLDVLPGLVARVAAKLVVIGPHIAGIVVVASEWRCCANYGGYFGSLMMD